MFGVAVKAKELRYSVDLTAEGAALHRSLREYVLRPTTELLSQFDVVDIETTVRTLQAITERASERGAAPGRTRGGFS